MIFKIIKLLNMFLNCGIEWGQMNLFGKGGARCSELICGYGNIKIFPRWKSVVIQFHKPLATETIVSFYAA